MQERARNQVQVLGKSGITDRIGVCDDPVELGCTKRGEPSTARTILQVRQKDHRKELPTYFGFLRQTSSHFHCAAARKRSCRLLAACRSIITRCAFTGRARVREADGR